MSLPMGFAAECCKQLRRGDRLRRSVMPVGVRGDRVDPDVALDVEHGRRQW